MKKKLIYLLSVTIAFALGSLVTYLTMSKRQMDALLQTRVPVTNVQQPSSVVDTSAELNNDSLLTEDNNNVKKPVSDLIASNLHQETKQQEGVSVNDYSANEVKKLVKDMPDYMLNQYIDKFMAKDASNEIADKRRFAERAIEELYSSNDSKPMAGTIKINFDSSMPTESQSTNTVQKFAKIYAHIDTNGEVPSSPYTFIKWVNNQTGKVMLFDKKDIIADRNQNWVSFKPDDGWEVGSYDVRFYQFTSELQPIAQTTYHIYEVIE